MEDAVVAWLSCHLLAGVPWPKPEAGLIRRLICQTRQDGWHFDDVLIERSLNGIDIRVGCSIKSFPVFGPQGAPADFVSAVWRQWVDQDSPFQRGRDQLALFAAEHAHAIAESWKGLLDAAHVMTPEMLAGRYKEDDEPSQSKRVAFRSMRCPTLISVDYHDSREETARLLGSLSLQEHDFAHSESRSITHAIALCQQSLTDSARARAGELWQSVLILAGEIRRKGGMIDLPVLLARLAYTFPLRQHPWYGSDWERMRTISAETISIVPSQIGGTVAIDRSDLHGQISKVLESRPCAVVLGSSGFGKTVLARQWVTRDSAATPIWIRPSDLAAAGGVRSVFSLRHTTTELFANSATPFRVVIDGLDRCFDDSAFAEATLVLNALLQPATRERCRIVVTCRPDDWDRVHRHLIRHGTHLEYLAVQVREISQDQLEKVAQQLPSLKPLVQRPHLRPLLRWPKVLDIVAMHWSAVDAPPTWTTESDFARWFWHSAIDREESMSVRGRTARKLAVMLADRMAAAARLDNFTSDELAALRELRDERHVHVDETAQTARFTHDLVADFSRLRELQAQAENAADYLRSRLQSPLWHRAVRLYGLDLLEQQPDSAEWEKLFAHFTTQSPADEIAQNLLLEAPVFALDQRAALERLWKVLAAENGKLLCRFLRQFLRVATVPNEQVLARLGEYGLEDRLEFAVRHRWPFAPYWLGLLAFLNAHGDEVVNLARDEVADVCLLWLPLVGVTDRGIKEAANLAVKSARIFYRSGEKRYSSHHKVSAEEKVCQALLAAAPVMPVEVTELALKLSGRRLPDSDDGLPTEEPQSRSRFFASYGPPHPWPEGPRISPAPVFCKAFMNGPAAEPFLHALPEVAAEVMFATLLEIPREGQSPDDGHDLDEHGFHTGEFRLETPFWTTGPFLSFLRVQPDVALSAIIRLVNFATDRALELRKDYRTPFEIPVTVDSQTTAWRGHQHSYFWHRGHVFGPKAVCCALSSLERWLYLLMDAEPNAIERRLKTILSGSRSIALGAVLVSVGKRKPELFLGVLRPVLAAPEFHWLDELALSPMNTGGFQSPMLSEPHVVRKAWSDWMQMPHRKEALGQIAMRMLLSSPEWRAAITEICATWQTRLDPGAQNPAPVWLHRMVAQFDLSNWRAQAHKSGALLTFDPPDTLPQPTAAEQEQMQRFEKLGLIPFECRRILLGEREPSEEQLATWWNDLSAIRGIAVPDEERGIRDVEDAACGIVAVAVVHHRQWLAADPAREGEAFKILEEVGAAPPGKFWFVHDDISDFKWDIFAAWAITTLWAEQPDEPFLRGAVAGLAMWERYLVVERVLRVAAAHRAELGNHFNALLSHAIRYAQIRHIVQIEKYAEKKTVNLERWTKRLINNFVRKKISPLPSNWAEIRDAIPGRFWNGSMTNSFDIGHVNAALAWAEDIAQAKDPREREEWLHLHRQAVLTAVYRMEEWTRIESEAGSDEVGDSQRKWPYRDEEHLLRRVARIVARLQPNELHSPLWTPILTLGTNAPRWVQSFIGRWLIEAAGPDVPAPALIEQWVEMLKFAENSPNWKLASRRPWDMDDTWKDLLGLSSFTADFWRAELAPAVNAIRPFLERWALPRLSHDDTARTIIHFLKTGAAAAIRIDGLLWLGQCVPVDDQYFWHDDSTRDAFAGFLRLLYDENWKDIIASRTPREAFMNFALKLAALQHPLGSEILTLAGARMGGTGA
ncbi:MAG: hypothetical protein QOG67_180 [Verrucomicrobiota bacterium]